jgi:hypothetical protein
VRVRAIGAVVGLALLAVLSSCTSPIEPTAALEPTEPTVTGPSADASEGPVAFVPPPFRPDFAKVANDYYKLGFLPDGMPGRTSDDGLVIAHPLYPRYVIDDWLAQYEQSPSAELETALLTVAHAAVDRMEPLGGALVAMYEPGGGARLYERHYSALTQGYYASRLWRVGELAGDEELLEAARRSFEALLVPIEDGGVYIELPNGPALEEVPQHPPALILNGWASALAGAWTYFELSGDERARDLVLDSSATMADLLPLYDVPEVANSRYGLTGYVYLRITGDGDQIGPGRLELSDGEVVPFVQDATSRWQPSLFSDGVADDGSWSQVRMNVIASVATPVTVVVELAGEIESVEAYLGRYDPLSYKPIEEEWIALDGWQQTGGQLEISLSPALARAVAYPTNFVKVIDGRNTNVYHATHVNRLRELAEISGIDALTQWADRWDEALCSWGDMPIYDGLSARRTKTPDGATEADGCRPL